MGGIPRVAGSVGIFLALTTDFLLKIAIFAVGLTGSGAEKVGVKFALSPVVRREYNGRE